MRKLSSICLLSLLIISAVYADVYMHNPRGSNNRLNEASTDRDNPDRLMDTQNNDKGGYCWGPPMYFYAGSELTIEWTDQHGCGNNPNEHCNIVIQYMCGPEVRDGATTTTIPDDANTYNQIVNPDPLTGKDNDTYLYGMHEGYQYYQDCKTRERNKGLFTADQNLNGRDTAIYTRQDNNNNRQGFECPEERDYYPYWHPTPWKDIAILVDNDAYCSYFQSESQNVKAKNYCSLMQYNNNETCIDNGGTWITRSPWKIPPPVCEQAQFTRDNHLGNSVGPDHQGYASTFNWTIPYDIQANCTLRLRYNISTGDYDGWGFTNGTFVDSKFNDALSPVTQDETVLYFGNPFEMALNTDQYGRTFQDRSYIFDIRDRPSNVPDDARIYNLNVRGKRGNIVQVYPAVEYDFVPGRLHTTVGDYVHFQWTGCDTNPANNEGEGTRQTDRSNIAQMLNPSVNLPNDNPSDPMFDDYAAQARMAMLDQTDCLTYDQLADKNGNNDNNIEQDVQNCMKLNAAEPYFDGGIYRMNKTGQWSYFNTRNNNFSNRSQKGYMTTESSFPTWAIVAIGIVGAGAVVAAVAGGAVLYAKSHAAAAAV